MAKAGSNGWATGGLVVVGVSHHAAPVEVRERLALEPADWRAVAPLPGVLLSTCNRVEAYAWAGGGGRRVATQLKRALARAAGVPLPTLEPHLFTHLGAGALLHLVRVAAGLDSLVVGEEQIRGQVREALRLANAAGPLPGPLVGVFHRAVEAARRLRAGTPLGQHPSVAAAAVELARSTPELAGHGLAGEPVVVLGAGLMAKAALDRLVADEARVVLLNRTPRHAEQLAAAWGGAIGTGPLEALPSLLPEAALVVGATASRRPVLDVATVEAALGRRRGKPPLVLLDVAVPRDVEAAVRQLPGVRLIDLDDLEQLCPVDATARRAEAARVEALARAEAEAIARWLRLRAVSPAIVELRQHGERIRARELRRSAARLRGLSPEQQAAVEALTSSIVNQLLHGPTVVLRDAAARPRGLGRSRSLVQRVMRLDRTRQAGSS